MLSLCSLMTCKTVTSIFFRAIHCYLTITAVRAFLLSAQYQASQFLITEAYDSALCLSSTKNILTVLCSFNHFYFCWLKQLPELELRLCEKLWVAAPDRSGPISPLALQLTVQVCCLFYSLLHRIFFKGKVKSVIFD